MSNPRGGGKLLSAVTATGAGAAVALNGACRSATMQVSFTGGTFTALSVKLQGSVDGGDNWFDLATASTTVTGEVQFSVDKPFSAVRANLVTYTLATGTPAVTVSFAAVG